MAALDIAAQADIIIVDGGSDDGSLARGDLEAKNVRGLLVKTSAGGLSAQLRAAYAFALDQGYEGIITIDGNNKDDPEAIPRFIDALRAGVDFVQGSRFIAGGRGVNTPRLREFAVRWVHAPLLSLFSRFRWTDTTQGFRAYSARLVRDQRLALFRDVLSSYELLAYLSYRAPRLKFRCIELPTLRSYPVTGAVPTKISNIRGNAELFKILLYACLGFYNPSTRRLRAFWFVLMTVILFASFYKDAFGFSHPQDFFWHQIDSEAIVMMRLIETDTHNFFSRGGLMINHHSWEIYDEDKNKIDFASYFSSIYEFYFSDIRPVKFYEKRKQENLFLPYISSIGLQGWIYGVFDQGLKLIGVEAKERWQYMQRATALALALTLAGLVMLIAFEFGKVGGALAFMFTLTSPWLTVFARNLYWMPFLWFLPMLWCWRYYVSRAPPRGRDLIIFSAGFFAIVFLVSLKSYEYLSSILVAAGAVVVYGCTKNNFDWPRLFRHGGLLVANGLMSFSMVVAVHLYVIGSYLGNFSRGWNLFVNNVLWRTHGPTEFSGDGELGYVASYSTLRVVGLYFDGALQNVFHLVHLKGYIIFPVLLLVGLACLIAPAVRGQNWRDQNWHRVASLALFFGLCMLAPLSWHILAKNHSVLHTHMNYVLWHLPTLIILPALVWALCVDTAKRIGVKPLLINFMSLFAFVAVLAFYLA